MKDMRLSTKEQTEIMSPSPPIYPYGLCISLCNDELEKLGLSYEDLQTGDMIDFRCLASVTSKSSHENGDGENQRVELQIQFMEAEDEEKEKEPVIRKLYKR
jgi:hypothetical protein